MRVDDLRYSAYTRMPSENRNRSTTGGKQSKMKADLSQVAATDQIPEPSDTRIVLHNQYQNLVDVAVIYQIPTFPETTIYIQSEWAEYLNPRIPSLNTTIIDYMMKANTGNETARRPDILAEYTLGALLTNGLARVGANYQFQGDPRLTQEPDGTPELDGSFWLSQKGDFFTVDAEEAESKNWLQLRVDSTIQGYAYKCNPGQSN